MVSNSDIRERMEVVGSDWRHVGTVDRLDGNDRIKLTRGDSADGRHHFVPTNWVEHVDSTIHLDRPADEVLGAI